MKSRPINSYTAADLTHVASVLTLVVLALFLATTSQSAVGLLPTKSPAKKLANAVQLFDFQNRPLPAEQMILDAAAQYRESGDSIGLADAYRVYALFFRSRSLNQPNYAEHFRKKGFLDLEATYDRRYDRSLHYLALAEAIYSANAKHDLLSNVYFHMGDVSVLKGDLKEACQYYDQSISAQSTFHAEHPETLTELPKGAKSFDDALRASKQYAGCK
jgi:hypothetical protein